jgi:PAS domain S-box-containing protein
MDSDLDLPPKRAAAPSGRLSNGAEWQSMLSIDELKQRPSRPPNYTGESQALIALVRSMATSPEGILQKLAETALTLCRGQSAGLSLLEDTDQRQNFHWRALTGVWASHINGGTPRDFGPCGVVLDRNAPQICRHAEIDFPYFGDVSPLVEEALLVPFYLDGEAVGTVWVVSHDQHRFDAEDLRILTNLGDFASAAYQTYLSLSTTQHIAAIVESSDDAIISKNLDGIITSWNRGAQRLFGYLAEEVIGKPINILIPLDRQNEEPVILQRLRRGEKIDHYETIRRRKDGSRVEISLTISPVRNPSGTIIGASKIARDITERNRSQAQIALLAREAEHRSKNLLATVQATVRLTQSNTVEGFKRALEGRIQALANVHRLFVEARWKGADIHSLVSEELAAYSPDKEGRVQISGPNYLLEPTTAQAIAVILHELATNAAKYGALSVSNGRIQVEWSGGPEQPLVLRWIEADGPPVEPANHQGFGTRVINNVICNQLKGELRFDWRTEGLACEIILPPQGFSVRLNGEGGHGSGPVSSA